MIVVLHVVPGHEVADLVRAACTVQFKQTQKQQRPMHCVDQTNTEAAVAHRVVHLDEALEGRSREVQLRLSCHVAHRRRHQRGIAPAHSSKWRKAGFGTQIELGELHTVAPAHHNSTWRKAGKQEWVPDWAGWTAHAVRKMARLRSKPPLAQ